LASATAGDTHALSPANKGSAAVAYLYLIAAIVFEVVATGALKSADSFTKPVPSIIVIVGYGAAFYLLSLSLRSIEVGVAYAIWCGIGIVLVAVIGAVFYGETIDLAAVTGFGLIISGVAVLGFFSDSSLG
jgi:small multidrug resistance pump